MQLSPRECVIDSSSEAGRLRHTLQRSGVLITERRKGEPGPPVPFCWATDRTPPSPLQGIFHPKILCKTSTDCLSLKLEQPVLSCVSRSICGEWNGVCGCALSAPTAQMDLQQAMASLAALIKYLEVRGDVSCKVLHLSSPHATLCSSCLMTLALAATDWRHWTSLAT